MKNSQVVCVRIKLKEGCLDAVSKWAKELTNREEEVIESLKNEDVYVESAFLDKIEDSHYLIYYMRVRNVEFAKNAVQNSILPIDIFHSEFKQQCWSDKVQLKPLIDFLNL